MLLMKNKIMSSGGRATTSTKLRVKYWWQNGR